jgi:hypothetical protein
MVDKHLQSVEALLSARGELGYVCNYPDADYYMRNPRVDGTDTQDMLLGEMAAASEGKRETCTNSRMTGVIGDDNPHQNLLNVQLGVNTQGLSCKVTA